ncbi:MAG: ATP-binding protein, partial [Cyanobacteria bacterium J06597_16]
GDDSEALPYPAGTLHIAVHQQPGEIIVQYSDDGCGIPLVNQHRIFEPFFTTARKLGGSGLGLHLIYNLVTQTLQGSINVSSVPGTGTTFTLFLPNRIAEKVPD